MRILKFLFVSISFIQLFTAIWFAQSQPSVDREISIQISGFSSTGDRFIFKDQNAREHTFDSNQTRSLGRFAVGSNYSLTQTSGLRQCRMTNNQGEISSTDLLIVVDCANSTANPNPTPTPTSTPSPTPTPTIPMPTGKFGDFDLVSRSSDQKSFGTFYGSITPSIGGIDDTGVTEGQFVAYMTSWNVDPKHGGKARQIMWFNRGNGRAAVVSRASDGIGGDKDSYNPSIDNKGYAVAFESLATNLVQNDANKASDIFVWTLMDDTVRCVTCSGNYGSIDASISGDGNYVAFTSYASNLTSGVEGNSAANVYLANLRTSEITLISKDAKTGKGLSGMHASVSEDGSRVAFYSYSDKLADGDNNKLWDIFVWTRGNPKLKRISLTANGQERDQGSESTSRVVKPTISGNGKFVTFATTATNMSGGQTKPQNVYVAEIDTGRIVRASAGVENVSGNDDSPVEQGERITISYDGKWVAFTTKSTNLGGKIIVKNIDTGEIIPLVTEGSGVVGTPTLSRNGKCISFASNQELDKRFKSTGIFTTCR